MGLKVGSPIFGSQVFDSQVFGSQVFFRKQQHVNVEQDH